MLGEQFNQKSLIFNSFKSHYRKKFLKIGIKTKKIYGYHDENGQLHYFITLGSAFLSGMNSAQFAKSENINLYNLTSPFLTVASNVESFSE